MQRVHNTDMVCHLWANQSQTEARNAGGTVFFAGPTIFSYGYHFPMAKHLPNNVVLVNSASYSVTTSGHQHSVRYALAGSKTVFTVSDVLAKTKKEHRANIKHYLMRVEQWITRASTARGNKDNYLANAQSLLEEMQRYGEEFRVSTPSLTIDDTTLEQFKLAAVRAGKAEKQRVARQKMKIASQAKEAIAQWRVFERVSIPYDMRPNHQLLRYKSGDADIYTSDNAVIPLSFAQKIWCLVSKCHDSQTGFDPAVRIPIGNFSLTRITDEGNLQAACHWIKYAELQRMAIQLGLVKEEVAA